jgi:hypothetical protein
MEFADFCIIFQANPMDSTEIHGARDWKRIFLGGRFQLYGVLRRPVGAK